MNFFFLLFLLCMAASFRLFTTLPHLSLLFHGNALLLHVNPCMLGGVAVRGRTQTRSKSLESCKGEVERKERRISWGLCSMEESRSAGEARLSEELKRRRHTVGDVR